MCWVLLQTTRPNLLNTRPQGRPSSGRHVLRNKVSVIFPWLRDFYITQNPFHAKAAKINAQRPGENYCLHKFFIKKILGDLVRILRCRKKNKDKRGTSPKNSAFNAVFPKRCRMSNCEWRKIGHARRKRHGKNTEMLYFTCISSTYIPLRRLR